MEFILRIHWDNPGHPFLQKAQDISRIQVQKDGGIPELSHRKGDGELEYHVADPPHEIEVRIPFEPTIGGVKATVLEVNQTYTVSGTSLVEKEATLGGGTKVTRHPLIRTVQNTAASTGARSVFDLFVTTDFVDVTEHWKKWVDAPTSCKAQGLSCWRAYEILHEPGTEMRVLGSTTGRPLLWIVLVPKACKSATSVSRLVFYRPAFYEHDRLDDPQHASHGMYAIARYLVRPRHHEHGPSPGIWWAWDRYHTISDDEHRTVKGVAQFYDWLCAGFEHALDACGRSVVMFFPLPHGTGFGAAATGNLPALLDKACAFLWSIGQLGAGASALPRGKLALAGYSAGGAGLWAALDANKASVSEVYSFDANGVGAQGAALAQWAWNTSNFRLRLATGFPAMFIDHERVARTVRDRLAINPSSRSATGGEVTMHPSTEAFYGPTGHKWWLHAFSEFPPALTLPEWQGYARDTRHQFVIYGGEDPGFAPGTTGERWTGVTFLEQFLRSSLL
jgi:hypothetical protein